MLRPLTAIKNSSYAVRIAAIAACLLVLVLGFISVTPRARLNVVQVGAITFYAIVCYRYLRTVPNENEPPFDDIGLPWLGLIAGVLSWATTLSVFFVGDDFAHLATAQGEKLETLWNLTRYGQSGTFLRPVGFASIFIDHSIWQASPVGYHVTNLIIHVASAAAVYVILRQLGKSGYMSAVTSGIFAAMPVQVEAVAWMGARFDLLATCFCLWSVVLYLLARERPRFAGLAFSGALFLYILAVLSKESAFILPLLIFAIEKLIFHTLAIRKVVAFVAIGAAVFACRFIVLGGIGGYSGGGKQSALSFTPSTLEGLLLRGPTQILFGFNWTEPPGWLNVGLASFTFGLFLYMATISKRELVRAPMIRLGICWIILTMLPAHFLLLVGSDTNGSRVLYMASAGAALIFGELVGGIIDQRVRNFAWVSLVILFNIGVLNNIAAWRYTGELSKDVLNQLRQHEPSPAPGTVFVIANMPKTVRGVFFFNVGLDAGVRMTYNREDISAAREAEVQDSPERDTSKEIIFIWDPTDKQLLRR